MSTPDEARSPSRFPPCPFLPAAPATMDWRALHALRDTRGPELYLRCLAYAQFLWLCGKAARALLSVDRALLCQLDAEDVVLQGHPLPYRAVVWIVSSTPADAFIGNPRAHYQHLADRVRGPRADQRRWRAWAAWHLVRLARPSLPGDARHAVVEPDFDSIRDGLAAHGIAGETGWWQTARADALVRSGRLFADGRAPVPTGG